MKTTIFVVTIVTIFILNFFVYQPYLFTKEKFEDAYVVWIVDGDTIIVKIDGKKEKVRFIGIDTPEFRNKYNKPEPIAKEAFLYTKKVLKNQTVQMESDKFAGNRDKYGRLLRYIYINGSLHNAELIKIGYASVFKKFVFSKKEEFLLYENEAKQSRKGIWRR
jgi:micrococcal nuclease